MNIAVAVYQIPYTQRKEVVNSILSVKDNKFSKEESEVLNYLSSNEEVDFAEMMMATRKGAISFFEELNNKDAEDYIAHLQKTGGAQYIPTFEKFLKGK